MAMLAEAQVFNVFFAEPPPSDTSLAMDWLHGIGCKVEVQADRWVLSTQNPQVTPEAMQGQIEHKLCMTGKVRVQPVEDETYPDW